ncbi:MAG TPA: glycosyltransferase family 39 protein [Candidatus Bathyarchaeia archaeon]|nr:glycosyltransferase family 39 protein [Candidatus Bathyarchaeia archaeon]
MRRKRLLLGTMVALQLAWFAVRTRVIEAPVDSALLSVIGLTVLAGIALALVPEAAGERLGTLGRAARITASEGRVLAVLAVLSIAIGTWIALATPRPGWDEQAMRHASRIVARRGIDGLAVVYRQQRWLGLHHPPLVPILFGIAMRVFGARLVVARLVAVLFSTLTVVVAARIANQLYGPATALRAGLMLLSFPLFVRIGGSAMNDPVVTCFAVLSVLLAIGLAREPAGARRAEGALLGLTLGVGLVSKYTMVLVCPVVVGILAVSGQLRRRAPAVLVAFLVAGAILATWLVVATRIGVLGPQLAWLKTGAGVATHSKRHYALDALLTKVPSAVGVYNLPLVALGVLAIARRRERPGFVLVLWIGLVAVPLALTLPDNRYFLPAFPALAIVAARGLEGLPDGRAEAIVLALVLCAAVVIYFLTIESTRRAFLF